MRNGIYTMLKRHQQLLFISLAVLEIFLPSIMAGVCFVDDVQMFKELLHMREWNLKGIFSPTGGIYFRPLLALSFILDREIWLLNERIMHFENVVFHLLNIAIVYNLALQLLPENEREESYSPLIAALCFGLHPINTESVNWISGRSDVMAGTFVLLSALYLVKFKMGYKRRFLLFSLLSLILGVLTKEVAMAFIPAAFFIIVARDSNTSVAKTHNNKTNIKPLMAACLLLAILTVLASLYFVARHHILSSTTSSSLGKTINAISSDPSNSLFVCLRAFGFYMKKLFAPLPLDFTIREVDPLYELFALPVLLLCLFIAIKRTLLSALFTASILLITPSLLIAFGNIAWMPYAERYVYVSSAFIIIPSVFYIREKAASLTSRTTIKACVPALIILMSVITLERNIYWMKTTAPYDKVKVLVEK